jgi:hypothetical protein
LKCLKSLNLEKNLESENNQELGKWSGKVRPSQSHLRKIEKSEIFLPHRKISWPWSHVESLTHTYLWM